MQLTTREPISSQHRKYRKTQQNELSELKRFVAENISQTDASLFALIHDKLGLGNLLNLEEIRHLSEVAHVLTD